MSELSVDNIIPETQEKENDKVEKNENDNTENNSQSNESQDFHLIAEDETQEASQLIINDNNQTKDDNNVKVNQHEADAKPVDEEARDSDKDTGAKVIIETENEINDLENKQKNEEDEIVECTPPNEIFSPRKRQLTGIESQKRKAENDDEHAVKFQRTSSREDALVSVRKKLETDEESEIPETAKESKGNDTSAAVEKDSKSEDKAGSPGKKLVEIPKDDVEKTTEDKMEIAEENIIEKSTENSSKASESTEKCEKNSELVDELDKSSSKLSEIPQQSAIDEKIEKMEVDSTTSSVEKSEQIEKSTLSMKKSRMSIEVIYDKALAPPSKPKELVEIDEDGEKIILDSSQEENSHIDTSYKTCESKSATDSYKSVGSTKTSDSNDNQLTNGNETKKSDVDTTVSISSEQNDSTEPSGELKMNFPTPISKKPPEILNLISDSEGDSFTIDDKSKGKIIPVEKELNVVVKIKCLIQFNENTKEIAGKEFLTIDIENLADIHLSRRRNSDASALADVSDNKDPTSPGSVTSNPNPYPLNPSRLSLISSASTSSSSSSGSGKLISKDNIHFSLPRGLPKHAKKNQDNIDEATEKLKKEWKNLNLLTSGIINFVNSEILSTDLHNGTNEQDTLERLTSSTPETQKDIATPKSSKKGRVGKRSRQNSRSSRTNGTVKLSPTTLPSMQEVKNENDGNDSLVSSEVSTPSRQSARSLSILRNQTPVYDPSDALVGKECFAKWSDNNYYPGKVIGKSKGKFKVNFLDGKNKVLIEDFVVPMPKTLGEGLSVYAITPDDGYGSCGIIIEIQKIKDDILYTVETDEGEKVKVPIKDIFMTADQVQFLKEIVNSDVKSPPSTPSMGKVTLDNVVEGSRRTKSISGVSTPKSVRAKGRSITKVLENEPSASGIILKNKIDEHSTASDSNYSIIADSEVEGVEPEVIDTPNDLAPKGPPSRVKGKSRNRKKSEDQEIIATLGPIPDTGSNIFKGLSFILSCARLETLDRYKTDKRELANSETETENEAEWNRIPFVKDRLISQIAAGGGIIYEEFKDIPIDEHKNTKLITNVPNTTGKSLLCLSVNIHPVNHRWIIRCCQENKLVNVSEESLPAGWSFDKDSYVDMYQRPNARPLGHAVIVIPKIPSNEVSIDFWQRIILNAGGAVRIIENQSETFMEGTVILANEKCPNWIKERAAEWKIPLVTTTWLIQSLIEGKMMPYDGHQLYQHNPKKSKD